MKKLLAVATIALALTTILEFHFVTPAFAARARGRSVDRTADTMYRTIHAALRRQRGQTSFANVEMRNSYSANRGALESTEGVVAQAAAMPADGAGARREQQESDVYKLGPKGSHLLYLLNNYRGLQVVSFARGLNHPEVVGRVSATGNFPNDMYIDEAHHRILVLERTYIDENTEAYTPNQSRIVVYDIQDPAHPTIAQIVEVRGEIVDSRMVGDILYVASSTRPDWTQRNYANSAKGNVSSYSLAEKEVKQVQNQEMSLPVSRHENMGIVEVEKDGKYQYYVTAVLTQNQWGWWDRQSEVEVLDINSPTGEIKSLMTVAARGRIKSRSWVTIKDGSLLVASNYFTNQAGVTTNSSGEIIKDRWTPSRGRIALEVFHLPSGDERDVVLTERQFQNRLGHLDLMLENVPAAKQDASRETLLDDLQYGLRGRFMRVGTGAQAKLRKPFADLFETRGDTNGLSADLQSVRFSKTEATLAWVPANKIDPIDTFDISNVRKGVPHKHRIQFDGYVGKHWPISFQGREYYLGLGFIQNVANSDRNERFVQVKLFERVERRGKVGLEEVSTLQLRDTGAWVNTEDQDKLFEVKMGADGHGTLLFQTSISRNGNYTQGGKLIGFDLNLVDADQDKTPLFREGGLLAGNAGWLRRVFSNPHLEDVINAFSDRELAIFSAGTPAILADAEQIHRAGTVLELARNIVGYTSLGEGHQARGVQIVSDDSDIFDRSNPGSTTLRLVSPQTADQPRAELEQRTDLELNLGGKYFAHAKSSDGKYLLVLTRTEHVSSEETAIQRPYWHGHSRNYDYFLKVISLEARTGQESRLHVVGAKDWQATGTDFSSSLGMPTIVTDEPVLEPATPQETATHVANLRTELSGLVEIGPHRFAYFAGNILKQIEITNAGVELHDIAVQNNHGLTADSNPRLIDVGGLHYVLFTRPLEGASNAPLHEAQAEYTQGEFNYVRHFVAPITAQGGGGEWFMGPAVNIPGIPIAKSGSHLITREDVVLDWAEVDDTTIRTGDRTVVNRSNQQLTRPALNVVHLANGVATLTDHHLDREISGRLHVSGETIFALGEDTNNYRYSSYDNQTRNPRLVTYGVDATTHELTESHQLIHGLSLQGNLSLEYVGQHPTMDGMHLAVIRNSRRAQVVAWAEGARPSVMNVYQLDEQMARPLTPASEFTLPVGSGYYWGYGNRKTDRISLNIVNSEPSLTFTAGLGGVCQLFLTKDE